MAGLAQRAAESKTRSWGSARVLDARKFLLILGIFCTENCGSSEQFSCARGAVGPRHHLNFSKIFSSNSLGGCSWGDVFFFAIVIPPLTGFNFSNTLDPDVSSSFSSYKSNHGNPSCWYFSYVTGVGGAVCPVICLKSTLDTR